MVGSQCLYHILCVTLDNWDIFVSVNWAIYDNYCMAHGCATCKMSFFRFSMDSSCWVYHCLVASLSWLPSYIWVTLNGWFTMSISHFVCNIRQLGHFCKCKLGYLWQLLYGSWLCHLQNVIFSLFKNYLNTRRVLVEHLFSTRVFSSTSRGWFWYSSIFE